jgi:hypothetical protein
MCIAMSMTHNVHHSEPLTSRINCVDSVEALRDFNGDVPMLVVGSEKPFVVHEANDAFVAKFGYEKGVVRGRSIGFLQGPKTNNGALSGALGTNSKGCDSANEDCAVPIPAEKPVILYSNSGAESPLNVRSFPMKTLDGKSTRLVSFDESRTIALDIAQQESASAKVIVEISNRQALTFANSKFLDLYGLKESQVCAMRAPILHSQTFLQRRRTHTVRH